MVKKLIAIIPARKNSKRIVNKNIIEFDGKPIIYWTIDAALKSEIFDRIVVSTDCEKIAQISEDFGVKVPFLRSGLADDFTPVSEVSISTLNQAKDYWNEDYEVVVQMMPNCPNRNKDDIKNAYNFFSDNNLDFLLSCSKFHSSIPWWSFTLSKDNKPNYNFPKLLKSRSQDLDETYCNSGAIWIAKSSKLLKEKTFYGKNHFSYPINWSSALDIDTYDDLEIAKAARAISKYNND